MNLVWSAWSRSKLVSDITSEASIGPAVNITRPAIHAAAAEPAAWVVMGSGSSSSGRDWGGEAQPRAVAVPTARDRLEE